MNLSQKTIAILFFFTLVFITPSCNKDDDNMISPVDLLVGTYSGLYTEQSCPPGSSIALDLVAAEVTKTSDMSVNVKLSLTGVGDLYDFTGDIDTDSTFVISTFELDGKEVYGGGQFGEKDNVKFFLTDGCTFLGSEAPIAIYDGNK